MFRLLRFFSLSSLILVVIAAIALAVFSQHSLHNTLLIQGQDENLAIAGVIGGHLKSSFQDLVGTERPPSSEPVRHQFDLKLREQLVGRSIVRVVIYDSDLRPIYSTGERTGPPDFKPADLDRVMDDHVVSRHQHADRFESAYGVLSDVDLVYTLIPMGVMGERIDVIMAVYSDVSTMFQRAQNNRWQVGFAIILILMLLYAVLYFVVRYANGELKKNHDALQASLKELEQVKHDLEQRVDERTQVLAREIEERKAAESDLREKERYLNTIMDNVFNGIITIDREAIITSFNPTAEQMFGYRADEVLGQNVKRLMPEEYLEHHDDYLRHYLETGERKIIGSPRRLNALRRDGAVFPIELAVTETRVGDTPYFIGTIRDMTEQQKAEQELSEARQKYYHQEKMAAIGSLAAGIVHEIGNPVAAIAGLIDQLCGSCPGVAMRSEDIRDNLCLVQDQVQRVIKITRDVSEFSTPHGSEPQLLDFNNLVGRTCRLMRHDQRFEQIELLLTLDNQIPAFYGVADHLVQVLMNLLVNAADAVSDCPNRASRIEVASHLGGERLYFSVVDNGCGMSAEVLVHAREAFFTTKPVGKGTGLGLSLCHSLISAHGGEMEFITEPDHGTEVRIDLPLVLEPVEKDSEAG